MNKNQLRNVLQTKEILEDSTNRVITNSNVLNSDLYTLLLKVREDTDPILKKISMISDMLLDIKVITGSSATNINLIKSGNIFNNKNASVLSNKIGLSKNQTKEISFQEDKSTLRSILPLSLVDTKTTQSTNLLNLFKYNKETKILFNRIGYSCTLVLTYAAREFLNAVELDFGDSKALPNITNIRYLNQDNIPVKTLFNGVESLDLNEKLIVDNKIELNFDTIFSNQIEIDFASNSQSFFTLENVQTYLNKYVETAEIVYGPITSKSPILKASVDSDAITDNVQISISTDLSSWIPMETTSSLNLSGNSKIVSFNTINELSFKTGEDVKTMYVRFTLVNKGTDLEKSKSFKTVKETNLSRNPLNILETKYTNYRLKNTPKNFGNSSTRSNTLLTEIDLATINKLTIDNKHMFLGLVNTDISTSTKNTSVSNVTYSDRYKKIDYKDISATKLDVVSGEIFDIDVIKYEEVLIKSRVEKNVVFKLKEAEGFYRIVTKGASLLLDLTTNFLDNSSSLTIIVPKEDIKIINEVDEVLYLIKKESLNTFEVDNTTYYYLNLVETLYEPFVIEGCTLNTLYPIVELETNEYAVEDGVLIINNVLENTASFYKTSAVKSDYSKHVSYLNGNFLKRETPEYTITSTTDVINSTNVIKLNNTFIKKGSITFKEIKDTDSEKYNANLNPEVRFLNIGTEEEPLYLKPDDVNEIDYIEV